MFIKTRQSRLDLKGKAVDEETLDVIVSLFVHMKYVLKLYIFYVLITLMFSVNLNSKVLLKTRLNLGNKHLSHCLENKSMAEFIAMGTPTIFKKYQEIDAIQEGRAI